MSERRYKEGDIVKHTARFLRSVRWHTNVPKDGRVSKDQAETSPLVHVVWCDDPEAGAVPIHAGNIMPADAPDYS